MKHIKKTFKGYPFAHRQPNHPGHCSLIHGHNWDFEVQFSCEDNNVDSNGFVLDFGKMKVVKDFLESNFDHTLVINHDDLAFHTAARLLTDLGFAKIVRVPNCGAEGLAEYVYDRIADLLPNLMGGSLKAFCLKDPDGRPILGWRRVYLQSVTVYEDEKNCAFYRPDLARYHQEDANAGEGEEY
jgi:6-pyruvoyltetrahydropterin/6-carboxytetrahydropterin synthase